MTFTFTQAVALYYLGFIAAMIVRFAWDDEVKGVELLFVGTFGGLVLGTFVAVVGGLVYAGITGQLPLAASDYSH